MFNVYWLVLFLVEVRRLNAIIVTMDDAQVTYANKKFLEYAYVGVKDRYDHIGWTFDIAGHPLHQWGNNVTMRFKFSEWSDKEYRPPVIDVKFRICDLINKEPYFGGMLKRAGIVCPIKAREYKLKNMTMSTEGFLEDWPMAKARLESEITMTDSKELIVNGFAVLSFKSEKEKQKRQRGYRH